MNISTSITIMMLAKNSRQNVILLTVRPSMSTVSSSVSGVRNQA